METQLNLTHETKRKKIKSNQIKSNQIKSNQIKSNQIKLGKAKNQSWQFQTSSLKQT
jgi:hypothetical protein